MSAILLARNPVIPRYWGQCATRCFTHNALGDTSTYMARSFRYMRGNVNALRVAVSNFYVTTGAGGAEAGVGTTTVSGSIEYPSGTFYPLTWAGSSSTTIAALSYKFSDARSVRIPDGAMFFIRLRLSNTVGIPYTDPGGGPNIYIAGGDALEATATDKTTSGTVNDSGFGGLMIWPSAVIGYTDRPGPAIIGDSRQAGLGDVTVDATGDQGDIARALGGIYGYQNLAVSGNEIDDFTASSTVRRALARYCSHIIDCSGINDIVFGGTSDATARTRLTAAAALFPGRPYLPATLSPVTTGAWTNPAGTDQTITAAEGDRASHNDWRRTDPFGYGYIEIADYQEITRNSGKWKAPGFTTDGIHATTAGAQAVVVTRRFPRSAWPGLPRIVT